MSDNNEINVDMTYRKSTKHTHVYADDNEGAAIPSLYIKKSACPATPPDVISVTVVFGE